MKLEPPPVCPGGVHPNKALIYKVSFHRKNIDQPSKKANLRYERSYFKRGVPQPQDLQNRIFYDLVMILT